MNWFKDYWQRLTQTPDEKKDSQTKPQAALQPQQIQPQSAEPQSASEPSQTVATDEAPPQAPQQETQDLPHVDMTPTAIFSQQQEPRAEARVVQLNDVHWIAFPSHTTVEIIENPKWYRVPAEPAYAYGLIPWQNRWIALIDAARLMELPTRAPDPLRYALVLAWQEQGKANVQYGAISLYRLPEIIWVRDRDACYMPDSDIIRYFGVSCFQYQGRAVPIIDAARLFNPPSELK